MQDATILDGTTVDLAEHSAVVAWHTLSSEQRGPSHIEILKGRPPDHVKGDKSFVCRLVGVGAEGRAIVAKRASSASVQIERIVYEEILPYLPVPSLRYFGSVSEPEAEFGWLFFEDAGSDRWRPKQPAELARAARWLGRMHTTAMHVPALARLPEKTPETYRAPLRRLQNAIPHRATIAALNSDDVALLETLLEQCHRLDSKWAQIRRWCAPLPATLIHGDFVAKNLRVQRGAEGIRLLPFDWDVAGYGVPAIDLACIDLAAYWSAVRDSWPHLSFRHVRRAATAGKIFFYGGCIEAELQGFTHRWLQRPMRRIRHYHDELSVALRELQDE